MPKLVVLLNESESEIKVCVITKLPKKQTKPEPRKVTNSISTLITVSVL